MLVDPLGPLSAAIHQALKFLEELLIAALTDPASLFKSQDISLYLYEETRPMSGLIVFAVMVIVLLGGALMIPAVRPLFARVGVSVAALSGGTVAFWALTYALNKEVSQRSVHAILAMGPKASQVGQTSSIFPDVGEGSWQAFYYAADLIIIATPVILAIVTIIAQMVTPSSAVLGTSVYAVGNGGKEIAKATVLSWLVSFTIAMPVIAAVYRLMQLIGGLDNKFLSFFLLALLAAGLIWFFKWAFGFLTTKVKARLIGGDTKAKVRGNTNGRGSGSGGSRGGSRHGGSSSPDRTPLPRSPSSAKPAPSGDEGSLPQGGSTTYGDLTVGNKPPSSPKQLSPGSSGTVEKKIIPRPARQAATNMVIRRVSNVHPAAKAAVTTIQLANKMRNKP